MSACVCEISSHSSTQALLVRVNDGLMRSARAHVFTRLYFFHLGEVEFQRRLSSKHGDEHLNLPTRAVNLDDLSFESLEWSVADAHGHAGPEVDFHFRRFARAFALQDRVHFRLGEWGRGRPGSDEPGHVRRVTHHVPRVVRHRHLHEHIPWEYLFFHDFPFPVLDLDLLFRWHEHVEDLVAHAERGHARAQVLGYVFLVPGVGVDGVPAASVLDCLLRHRSYRALRLWRLNRRELESALVRGRRRG